MENLKNTFSRFKRNGVQKCKENFYEAKNKPRSKRKSLLLGFTTVFGIFGVTLLAPVLPAIAKNIPNQSGKPDQLLPAPGPTPSHQPLPSEQIIGGIAGTGATLCALAVSSGSFLIGAACGLIIAIGILKAQGK